MGYMSILDKISKSKSVQSLMDFFKKRSEKTSTQLNNAKQSKEEQKQLPELNLSDDELKSLLDVELKDFFPTNGRWSSYCFNNTGELSRTYLPCNIENIDWLASLIHKELYEKGKNIPKDDICRYICTSGEFVKNSHEYELEIIKWQINFMLNDGSGWVLADGYDDMMMLFDPNCDIGFRESVIKTLSAIGLSKRIIEQGLEQNSDLWRDFVMSRAFENTYNPTAYVFNLYEDKLSPADEKHKQNWLKMRNYEYYQRHKQSVDSFGNPTEDMNLSYVDYATLKVELDQQHADRQAQIDEYREQLSM